MFYMVILTSELPLEVITPLLDFFPVHIQKEKQANFSRSTDRIWEVKGLFRNMQENASGIEKHAELELSENLTIAPLLSFFAG